MTTSRFALMLNAGALSLACAVLPAQAAIVTISGPSFDLSYDDSLLGLYGTPTVMGNSVFFTTGEILAQRFSAGSTTVTTLLEGLVITMRDALAIDSLAVNVLGDYFLEVADASVAVAGLLIAHDVAAPDATKTGAALAVDPSTPLTVVGSNTDWRASSGIDRHTSVGVGQSNVFLSGARSIGVSLGTELTASLGSGSGLREAFIEQKFSGLQLVVSPMRVPAPGTAALLLAALAAAALVRRR
jgi:hypothetical protein